MTKANEVVLGELREMLSVEESVELPKAVAALIKAQALRKGAGKPWVVTLMYDPLRDAVTMGQVGGDNSDPEHLAAVIKALQWAERSLSKKREALIAAKVAALESRLKKKEQE